MKYEESKKNMVHRGNNMKNKFLMTIFFSLAALLTITLTGCNKSKKAKNIEKPFVPSLPTDTKASVKVVGNYSNFEAIEAEFDRFNQIYPDVELSFSFLDNYKSVILPSLYSDEAPDIYFIFAWMIGMPKYEALFEIAENLSDPKLNINLNCIYEENIIKTPDGKTPMLPMFSQGYGMLVNEDLFKKEKLSVPQTYDELLDVCQKLKAAGYKSPMMGYYDNDSGWCASISYPYAHYLVKDNQEALEAINKLEPSAGEYLRPLYNLVDELVKTGCINPAYCKEEISDNYNKVILRFFEGDVPMMLVTADVVSGTKKRELKSEYFQHFPFTYRMYPTPVTKKGGIFISNSGVCLAVNSKSNQLDITNEFIRFLAQTKELNNLANIKRLIPITKNFSSDDFFAPMEKGEKIYANTLGILDDPLKIIRTNCNKIANGKMTVDQAVKEFGK
jgi:multiple sugar transport system substrate-binding protein